MSCPLYDYTYDNAGRLVNAVFKEKQHTGDAWSNTTMDFSINGTSGKITYDLNGNLLNMLHKGVLPGTATPITVDNLSYTYSSYSNKLLAVTDNMTNTTVNGQFGDFKDGTNGAAPDYVYDANGNVVIDLNKNAKDLANVVGANGIKYNFLDKPEQIRIAGKGTIQITYSADGEKLKRSFTPEPSGAVITTSYINQYIYQESSAGGGLVLQAINFEEGRIRIITPTSQGNGLDALIVDGNMDLPNGKRGAYDYFVMDYQQNVRMILTEEIHSASNTATMETNRSTLEENIFGQVGAANEVAVTRYATPPAWTGNTTAQVSRLGTNSTHNIGPNTLQKVMAGDQVSATVQYYHQGAAGGNSGNMVNTMLGSLVQAITGGSSTSNLVKNNAGNISTQLNGTGGFINAVQPNGSSPAGNTPQAFLTVIFFDERFNMVLAADGGVSQQQVAASVGSNGSSLTLANIKAPKNGYAYIYISNQSNNDVYFDNLQAGIVQGNIAEENHYYAYGLKIATLSSKKLGDSYEGSLKNNYLYQGDYSELDDDIGWHDFALRNYDAQIGRWVQQDPYQEFASPYVGMGSDPINLTDPSGGSTLPYQVIKLGGEMSQTAATAITLGEVVLKSVSTLSKSVFTLGGLLKAANIMFKGFQVANLLNNVFNTVKVGDPTADYLNSIMTREVDKDIEKLWTDSKHGTEQNHEWGATLVNMNGDYKVTLQHPGAGSGSVQATYPTAQRYNKRGKALGNYYGAFVAFIHTHPYPTAITKGFGFHAGDISGMREFFQKKNIIQGPLTKPFYLIESGSKRYAFVIEDMALAEKFFTETSDEKIQNLFNAGYNQSKKTTGQEKMVDGVLNVIGDQNATGLSLYQTGTDKTKFTKATKN